MTAVLDASSAPPEPAGTRRTHPAGIWRRGRIAALLAPLATLVMLGHSLVPDRPGHLGSLTETFLPWTGLVVPLLLVCAAVRRSATAATAVLLPALVWGLLHGGTLADKQTNGGDLTVVTHNVNEHNPRPGGTARDLAASGADVLALEELGDPSVYKKELAADYPYHAVRDTVGLWSRYPLTDTRTVDIAPWPSRGALRAEPLPRALLVGDLNGTTDDGALTALTSPMHSAQEAAGAGFGLTWPAAFPLARIDHILLRGIEARSAWTLPATDSDHLPVAASVKL
ncbi:endonuclease/exonuclease/phosphatase family protein [Streptomyces sp. ARC32]